MIKYIAWFGAMMAFYMMVAILVEIAIGPPHAWTYHWIVGSGVALYNAWYVINRHHDHLDPYP